MTKIRVHAQSNLSAAWLMKSFSLLFLLLSPSIFRLIEARQQPQLGGSTNVGRPGWMGFQLPTFASQAQSELTQAVQNLNKVDENGETALHRAVKKGDEMQIQFQYSIGASFEIRDKNDMTPLQVAVLDGNVRIVSELIRANANVKVLDSHEATLLHLAAFAGQAHLLEMLVKHKVASVDQLNKWGDTPLVTAITANSRNDRVVEILLKLGANPNPGLVFTNNVNKKTSLIGLAVDLNRHAQAQLLITAGSKLNLLDTDGLTPLSRAILNHNNPIANLLLKAGANIHSFTDGNIFFAAVHFDRCSNFKFAVDHGVDLEQRNLEEHTPLTFAQMLNKTDCMVKLLQVGANVNAQLPQANLHMPVLLRAIFDRQVQQVKSLIEHKANVNAIHKNATPLIAAISRIDFFEADVTSRREIVKVLLNANADPELTVGAHTPLQIATSEFDYEIATMLIAAGADINRVHNFETALSVAQRANHKDFATFLRSRGARLPLTTGEVVLLNIQKAVNWTWNFLLSPVAITAEISILLLATIIRLRNAYRQYHLSQAEAQKNNVLECKKRNNVILQSLNKVTLPFYPQNTWQLQENDFIFSAPVGDQQNAFDIIAKHLKLVCPSIKQVDLIKKQMSFRLTDPNNPKRYEIDAQGMLDNIRKEIQTNLQATPQYQLEQLRKEINRLTAGFELIAKQKERFENAIRSSNSLANNTRQELSTFMAIQSDKNLLADRRVAKAFNALHRSIAHFIPLPEQAEIIPYSVTQLQSEFKTVENLIAQLSEHSDVDKLRKQFLQTQNAETQLNQYLLQLNTSANQLAPSLKENMSDLKNAVYDYNQQQKSEQMLRAKDSAALARRKTQELLAQQPKPIVEKPKLVLAKPLAEVKEIKKSEPAKPVSASTSSSTSNVRRELNYRQLQIHIINLGDLLQAYSKEGTASNQLDYKYAILVETLRVFELTKQATFNHVAITIRNALMHNHRFIDFESIIEFAKSIARAPSGERTSVEILEDALRSADPGQKENMIHRLKKSLKKLEESDLYLEQAQAEQTSPTARVYLETLCYLLDDLSQIELEAGSSLTKFPNKVRAIKGILFCIGECQQQLFKFDPNDLHIKRFIKCKNQNTHGISELIKLAQTIREVVGHSENSEINDDQGYTILAQQLDHYRKQAENIKIDFDSTVIISEEPKYPVFRIT